MYYESGYECVLDPFSDPALSKRKLLYYKKEIARVTKAIKRTSRSLYENDLRNMSVKLLHDEKFRRFHKKRSQCKPLEILGLIDSMGFYVVPMPGDSRETKNRYITAILGVCLIR